MLYIQIAEVIVNYTLRYNENSIFYKRKNKKFTFVRIKQLVLKSYTKYGLAALSMIIVGAVLYYLSDIVTYVLIAWALSMIGAPVISFLRKSTGRTAAAIITLAGFVIVFLTLIWIFIPPLVTQAKNLANIDYNRIINVLEEPVRDWKNWLIENKFLLDSSPAARDTVQQLTNQDWIHTEKIELLPPGDSSSVTNIQLYIKVDASAWNPQNVKNQETPSEVDDFFYNFRKSLIHYINPANIQLIFNSVMSKFGNLLVGILSVFFISFFFLREQGLFDRMLTSVVPEKYEAQAHQALEETSNLLIRYFIGILLQMTIITIFVSTAMSLLGVKNSLLIGFFAAVMNVIPYIGPILGASFGVMITISSNLDLPFYSALVPLVTKVLIVFAVMQLIDNIILQPNIFSKSVKAHPLEIFLVVMIGAKIGGIPGMVLAIPFYTAFRVIGKVFLSEFKVIQQLTKNL